MSALSEFFLRTATAAVTVSMAAVIINATTRSEKVAGACRYAIQYGGVAAVLSLGLFVVTA